MSSASKMSKMFLNGGSGVRAPVVSRSVGASIARTAPAPLLRMKGRTPIMNLGSIMTQNSTPCRACGH